MELEKVIDDFNQFSDSLHIQWDLSHPQWILLRLSGSLDTGNSHSLNLVLNECFTDKTRGVALDMKDLNYMSSTGVGVLSSFLVQSKKISKPYVFLQPQDKVRKVFALLGFEQFFQMQDRLEEEAPL